jgi:predicted ATPase
MVSPNDGAWLCNRYGTNSAASAPNALAAERATVLALEDLQWLDSSSRDLLQHLVPLTENVPLLVIATARGEGANSHEFAFLDAARAIAN